MGSGRVVHLTISPAGAQVLQTELGLTVDLENFEPRQLRLGAKQSDPAESFITITTITRHRSPAARS